MSPESPSFELKAPDLFTAGTVGPPGQRVFYLQARERGLLVTLKVEKEQVNALAEYLAGLLERVARPADPVSGDLSLVEPVTPAWAVRSLGVGYDGDEDRVVIVAAERGENEEEDEDEEELEEQPAEEGEASAPEEGEGASARFHVSRAQAAAFVERARALVRAGRPPCGICGRPMNPGGHICPRSNGHGRDT